MSAPTPDEIASLLQVEHLLDQRWPESRIEPSLTRVSALLELLGSPQLSYPCIHIAGTNGKTSVARMVDALLTAFSRRTGRTTSPHLQSAVERICIDGKPVSPAHYVDTYREIEPFVQLVDEQSQSGGGPAMSKFEVVTAMAFAAFADAPVDIGVIEVGLGGRWDAWVRISPGSPRRSPASSRSSLRPSTQGRIAAPLRSSAGSPPKRWKAFCSKRSEPTR
jgi:dihydrofolate synthase/folylpolyglutamate synthase